MSNRVYAPFVSACILSVVGCVGQSKHVSYIRDSKIDQPYVQGMERAEAVVQMKPVGLVDVGYDLLWMSHDGPTVSANAVIVDCVSYLATRKPWGQYVRQPGDFSPGNRTTKTMNYILALEPVIVAIVEQEGSWYNSVDVVWGAHEDVESSPTGPYVGVAEEVILPKSFDYGTRLSPDAKIIAWYSPDMGIGPIPPDVGSEGEILIGPENARLEVRREGGSLVVIPYRIVPSGGEQMTGQQPSDDRSVLRPTASSDVAQRLLGRPTKGLEQSLGSEHGPMVRGYKEPDQLFGRA
jgi:hypothetical protein